MALNWYNQHSSITASQSQSTVTVKIVDRVRIYQEQSWNSDAWTVYVTLNGSRTDQTVSVPTYYGSPLMFNGSGETKTISVTIPDNLLGTSVTISFWAKKGSEWQGSGDDPAPSVTIQTVRPVNPSISWDSGTSLSAIDNGDGTLTATLNGGATIGGGATGTVYYRVWCENTRKNSDGSTAKNWTFAPTAYDTQVTIKVQAYFVYNGTTYTTSDNKTCTITVDSGDYFNYYDGTQWVQCKVFYYDGTNWVECRPYYYDGSNWVEISS